MGIPIKSAKEIEIMRAGGKILAEVLNQTVAFAKAGISTLELSQFAENIITKHNAYPSFKGYKGFPAAICTAIDEVVVHGIPQKNQILKEGDLLTIDCGVYFKGLHTDAARSITIGKSSETKQRLIKVAWESLNKAIAIIKPEIDLNEISKTIQRTVESAGFKIIYELTGHGIGRKLHESPHVYNFEQTKPGPSLKPGMTLAIEPIFSLSSNQIKTLKDNWTIVTEDQSCAVQVENTILVTQNGAEILTN